MSSFETLHIINNLLIEGKENAARETIIRLIDRLSDDEINYIRLPLNDLIRKVGLYPYMDRATANWQEKFLLEAFTVNIGDKEVVLHREQSKLLSGLLEGKNLAVSAPTSFGKSFIIDAYINLIKPKNIMIIVPTIALADEIRRRLQNKFKEDYKIITTTDITLSEKNILILPQERALNYQDKIKEIDLLVIDEFYKASKNEKDTRSISLQRAMLEFQKIAKQRYYLAPNISDLTENIFTKGIEFISFDCNTVALNIEKTYDKININYSKTQAFIDVLNKVDGKTLVYVNSHVSLSGVCTILFENEKNKNNIFLKDFANWIRKNYSSTWYLSFIVERGIATYNSSLHRSLTQIQLSVYESEMPLNIIVSTSSIIEGVNTCTKNIILWSNRISNSMLSFFTYRNIMGRTGRMFKYFVGEAFLLERPPEEEAVVLDLELQEEASLLLDEDEFADELSSDELNRIINFKNKMADLLGVKYSELKNIQELDASESSNLQRIAYAVLSNPSKFANVNLLNAEYKYWERQLNNIFYSIRPTNLGAKYSDILKVLLVIRNNWIKEIPEIITELEDFDLNIDDFFKIERLISHNLANFLKSFEIIYNKRVSYRPININPFIEKISHSFLPKNVFYLEEFGLPRFISRKIHLSQLIDLENNEREVNDVIKLFLEIGYDNLIQKVSDLDTFDKYVIGIFYKGIGG